MLEGAHADVGVCLTDDHGPTRDSQHRRRVESRIGGEYEMLVIKANL
jgi:hypothetical protein